LGQESLSCNSEKALSARKPSNYCILGGIWALFANRKIFKKFYKKPNKTLDKVFGMVKIE
jgi:hypothetical protein